MYVQWLKATESPLADEVIQKVFNLVRYQSITTRNSDDGIEINFPLASELLGISQGDILDALKSLEADEYIEISTVPYWAMV